LSTVSIERRIIRFVLALLAAGLFACASAPPGPEDSVPTDPEVEAHFRAAMSAAAEGRTDRAESMLSGLSDNHPELVAPQLNLAILYAEDGRNAESEALLLRLLESNPSQPEAWNQLGVIRRRDGRFKGADEAYLSALRLDPDYAPAHRNRGVLLDLYLNRPEEALEHYRKFIALSGGDSEVERWVAELEFRLGQAQVAEEAHR
jgi:tetratricopeptide (TPR) repeat protein